MKITHVSRSVSIGTTLLVTALLLQGCSGGGKSGGTATGEGLPHGSTKEQYKAAFAEVEAIELVTQLDAPEGSFANHGREAYFDAIKEWSDGKITFDIGYSNSHVQNPAEWDDALADGRLDIGQVIPSYEPEVYPLNAGIADATFLNGGRPISTLIVGAWQSEVALSDAAYGEEYSDEGIVSLVPSVPQGNPTGLYCAEPAQSLSELAGKLVAVSGKAKSTQVQALGAVPVSMPFTEQYEGLERGVIECAATGATAVQVGGLTPLVPFVNMDPEVSMSSPTITFGVGQAKWESLPLVARQLIYDLLEVYIAEASWGEPVRTNAVLKASMAAGGGVLPLQDDARRALAEANRGILARLGADGLDVEGFQAASDTWEDIILKELGYYNGTDWQVFEDKVDTDAYAKRFFQDVLLENRPA